jgi:hypothetical protein
MFAMKRYYDALVKLGGRVSEGQRRMLEANANAPDMTLDVLALARAAGQTNPNYTSSQYGRLGHILADAVRHRTKEHIWTRILGTDSRDPKTNLVQWRARRAGRGRWLLGRRKPSEMTQATQAKLLRVLEKRKVRPVGMTDAKEISFNAK